MAVDAFSNETHGGATRVDRYLCTIMQYAIDDGGTTTRQVPTEAASLAGLMERDAFSMLNARPAAGGGYTPFVVLTV